MSGNIFLLIDHIKGLHVNGDTIICGSTERIKIIKYIKKCGNMFKKELNKEAQQEYELLQELVEVIQND